MAETTRGQLPYPAGNKNNDVAGDINVLAGRLSAIMAIDIQGPLSNRPASSSAQWGRYFTVVGDNDSDNDGRRFRDSGSGWVELPRLARWQSYSPSLLSLDGDANPIFVNNPANTFRYRVDGDTCRVSVAANVRMQSAGNPGSGYCMTLPVDPLRAEVTGSCLLQGRSDAVAFTRQTAGVWTVALQRSYAGSQLMNPNVTYRDAFDIEFEISPQ